MDHWICRVLDGASVGVIIGALLNALPQLAAGLAVIWWLVRIYYEIRKGERDLRTLRLDPRKRERS